ncbi:hypothetical protein ACWEPN_36430 [Nonomuraea wenchangensis]
MGVSAAGACAVVAVALFLTDLETLSWIAGAGSFIVGVPSLVVALTQPNGAGQAGSTRGVPDSGSNPAEATPATGKKGSLTVDLTTPQIRIATRLHAALKGTGLGGLIAAVLVFFLKVPGTGQSELETFLQAWAVLGGMVAIPSFFGAAAGKDLLVVSRIGLTVVDKRRLRVKDASFSIPWALVRRIRIEPSGASHTLAVQFIYAESGTAERAQIEALIRCIKHDSVSYYDPTIFYDVARLYVASGGAERTELLHRTCKALARFGGDAYIQ